jgi:hypothetical protein
MIAPLRAMPPTPQAAAESVAVGAAARLPDTPAPRQAPPVVSPRLRIDGALNLVVLEFRAPDGKVLHSLPTPREIAAYRDEPRKEPQAPSLDLTG